MNHTQRALIIFPTYNEKDNLPQLVAKIFGLRIAGVQIIVVDDQSPDGTGDVAENLAKQYGAIEVDKHDRVLSIEEKPDHPKSNLAQTGIYMYDNRVYDFIRKLKPSQRGELEVTDLNNFYVKERTMTCEIIDWWVDAGTSFDELLRANTLVAQKVKNGELS